MSDESLANKSQPPPALPDAEYDAIYATVSETAQGRRFLAEYARRCRPAEPDASLAAIERMRAAVREDTGDRLDLLLEMADMAQAIARMRAEVLAIMPSPGAGPLDATEELDSIVQTTESATSRILTAAEQVQEIAWTMRESGSIEALCDELDARASEIYTACSFQDLTGQRTRKVIQLLRYLEDRINATMAAQDKAPAGDPSITGSLLQTGLDAVMQQKTRAQEERQDDRQDATLEDISRLMLAIEPTIGLQQAEDEQADAGIAQAAHDVRPELSVSETVMAEADSTREMAEWAVEPRTQKGPAQAKPVTEEALAPMTDWIVEDPAAPQPESEPAWMILRRMEAELDQQMEPESKAEASAFAPSAPIPAMPAAPILAEPAPPSPAFAEPGLFVAEAMSQLARTLRPAPLLPPAEFVFRASSKPTDPAAALAELESAMAAAEMKLLQPDEGAEAGEAMAAAPEPRDTAAATESDPDDFLFAPATLEQEQAATDFPIEPTPEAASQDAPEETRLLQDAAAEEPVPAVAAEWEDGTFPDPAAVTPQTPPPQETEAEQPRSRATYDPLAPLRALSDAQKIALFS